MYIKYLHAVVTKINLLIREGSLVGVIKGCNICITTTRGYYRNDIELLLLESIFL
jgi:hypothetical protein